VFIAEDKNRKNCRRRVCKIYFNGL